MAEHSARKVGPDRVAALLRPLAGQRATGVELDHHDERFRAVLGELDRLNSMTSDPDWSRVIASAEALLNSRSKDLRLAVALARAWWEGKGGEANLVPAVRLVAGLVRDFWTDLHPGPPGRPERFDALDLFAVWFDERWSTAALALPTGDRAAVGEGLAGLCDLVRAHLGDDAPDLAACERLADALRRSLPAATPEPEPLPEPEPAPVAPPASQPTPESLPPPEPVVPRIAAPSDPAPTTAAEAIAFLRSVRGRLFDAAALLRQADPAAALPYRLIRQTAWQHLDDLELDARGRLAWPPPPRRDVDALERLVRGQQWREVVELCEASLATRPLWLDLQHHAAAALAQLGHGAAREAIVHDVRGLLARLPAVIDYRFNDGTPVASPATRGWLAELAGEGTPSAAPARPTDPAGLQAAAGRAVSGRERFLLRCDLARACLAAGRGDVAAALLAALRDEAHRHELALWEPDLLSACLSQLVACARTLDTEARLRLGIDHALAELSAHDPPAALALEPAARGR